MQYITRGNSDPRGKQRVYFAAHPDELSALLPSIGAEILTSQNCAVWYDDLVRTIDARREQELREMQLFVIPVTLRLLTTDNAVLSAEYPFALAQHIPVLPLMQENGLEELFKNRMGSLQYLNKNHHDPSEAPYEEKLKKYLDAVLIGDELAKKVRAAFDAYIFLSYRKKDRAQAQTLMRLIHENDFARDIAIWYDEYLTPGENFNQAIRDALNKSSLFTLAVTPSLLEDNNYIQRIEYPEAVAADKAIVPVELTKTDRAALEQRYRNIPPCTPSQDRQALSAAFLTALHSLTLRENDTPEHNYFIALAYLNGIDVERDPKRALSLLTDCAEAGLPDAMEKLVEVYRNGLGAERDYREAIAWQKRLTDHWRQKAVGGSVPPEDPDPRFQHPGIEMRRFLFALEELGQYCSELPDYDAARAAFEEIVRWSRGFYSFSEKRTDAYISLGDVCRAEGELPTAQAYYEKALEFYERLQPDSERSHLRRKWALVYERLGDVCKLEGELTAMREYYKKSADFYQASAAETNTAETRSDLAISLGKLGDLHMAETDLPTAQAYYEKAAVLAEALAEETRSMAERRNLGITYERLGDVCLKQSGLSEAQTYYEKSLGIYEALATETKTSEARRDVAIALMRLGELYRCKDESTVAQAYYGQSLALFEALAEETGTAESFRELTVIRERRNELGSRAAQSTVLWPSDEEHSDRRQKLSAYEQLGSNCMEDGDFAAAQNAYEKALVLCRELVGETNAASDRRELSDLCGKAGNACRAGNNPTEARAYYESSLSVDKALAEEEKTVEARRRLAASYNTLGDFCAGINDLVSARNCYEKALTIREALMAEVGTKRGRWELSLAYRKMESLCRAEKKPLMAQKWKKKARDIQKA